MLNLNLSKYIQTPAGKIVISALLGIGLASIFRDVCNERNCMIQIGPSKAELEDTYRWDGRCYKLKGEAVSCMPDKKILNFS
jgi:hypothetical protein